MLYDELIQSNDYICHHGVKGQKWGVRHDKSSSNVKINRIASQNYNSAIDAYEKGGPSSNARKRIRDYHIRSKWGTHNNSNLNVYGKYRNEDGSLTRAGRKRLGKYGTKIVNDIEQLKRENDISYSKAAEHVIRKARSDLNRSGEHFGRMTAVSMGTVAAATAIASIASLPITAIMTPAITGSIALSTAIDNIITNEQRTTLDTISRMYDVDEDE